MANENSSLVQHLQSIITYSVVELLFDYELQPNTFQLIPEMDIATRFRIYYDGISISILHDNPITCHLHHFSILDVTRN